MTPKEKAEELFTKFNDVIPPNSEDDIVGFMKKDREASIKCAIIAVEEILELNVDWNSHGSMKSHHCGIESTQEFWEEVLTHLKQIQ